MAALFDLVLEHVPPPEAERRPVPHAGDHHRGGPLLGRLLTGRHLGGIVKPNMTIKALAATGKLIEQGRVSKVLGFRGWSVWPSTRRMAGDIVAIAGLTQTTVARHALRRRKSTKRSPPSPSTRRRSP